MSPSRRPPPVRYLRSATGTTARLIRTGQRSPDGNRLFRLHFLAADVKSTRLWTLAELQDEGVRFLKRRPRKIRG